MVEQQIASVINIKDDSRYQRKICSICRISLIQSNFEEFARYVYCKKQLLLTLQPCWINQGRVVEIDYTCFTIPNEFVVGSGLDYKENIIIFLMLSLKGRSIQIEGTILMKNKIMV